MPTKQFKWIDRDTAARDILQLVYHAPPQIAEQALKLLKAIRSPAIIPELKAIFLDEEYDKRLRGEIYDAICATSGNFDFSDFETVIGKVFSLSHPYAFRLLKYHPNNITWILRDVEVMKPSTQLYLYSGILPYLPEIATEPILKILSENESLLDSDLAFHLYKFGDESIRSWLHSHLKNIIYLWLTNAVEYGINQYWKRYVLILSLNRELKAWPELKEVLEQIDYGYLRDKIELEDSDRQRYIFLRLLIYVPHLPPDPLLKLFDDGKMFLDLETASLLHQYGNEQVQYWLYQRWGELIYLCLIDGVNVEPHDYAYRDEVRIVHILEKWPELKEAVFQNCSSIIEEYEVKKVRFQKMDYDYRDISDSDIQASVVWQALEQRRKAYIEADKSVSDADTFSTWETMIPRTEADIPRVAAEVVFLSTVTQFDNYASSRLQQFLKEGGDTWRHDEFLYIWDEHQTFSYTPLQFEAAYALRNAATPRMWETFVEVFLTRPTVFAALSNEFLEDNLFRWISRMTDMLSGVEPELPDEEIPLNARPWFRALVQRESNTP